VYPRADRRRCAPTAVCAAHGKSVGGVVGMLGMSGGSEFRTRKMVEYAGPPNCGFFAMGVRYASGACAINGTGTGESAQSKGWIAAAIARQSNPNGSPQGE
jgi:hypothetical protein